MPYGDYTLGEMVAKGEAIYLERIQPLVEPAESGKYVAIDLDSGDYEVDAEDPQAVLRLLARRPEGVIFGVKVGRRSADGRPIAGSFGFWPGHD